MDPEEDGRKRKHELDKRNFHLKVLSELAKANQRISQSFKYLCLLLCYIAIPGRSHFILREPSHKRVKFSDLNEIIASREQNDVENSELYNEVPWTQREIKGI